MNPYLERKLKDRSLQELEAAAPVGRAVDNPYPLRSPFTPTQATAMGPDLGRGLAQDVDPVENPMQPQEDTAPWQKLASLLPGAGMAIMHARGEGSAETRGQMNRYLEQATATNAADTQRAARSRDQATAYNNEIAQRKQERQRQKATDTIAAEDRSRRIGRENTETALAAQERDPATPKNRALQKSIAETYPGLLTPEELANFTTGDVEALTLSIKDRNRKQALQDEMTAERSKQKAERDFAIPGGGVGGSDYLERLAGGQPYSAQGTPPAQAPGAGAGGPAPVENPLIKDVADSYKGIENVPPVIMARVRGALAAAQGGATNKEMSQLHRDILTQVADDIKETSTRERQARQDEAAQTKADKQQDAQYAQQRNMRSIDQVRAKLVQLKKAVAPYLDENGNLKGNIPGSGVTGNLPEVFQLALTKDGKQIMRLKDELLDTRLREATGANAPPSEVKTFRKMGGIGAWNTDEDMIAGIRNAEAILDQQEAYLDANFVDASIRFHERVKEQEAKKAEQEAKKKTPDYTKLQGYKPPNAP